MISHMLFQKTGYGLNLSRNNIVAFEQSYKRHVHALSSDSLLLSSQSIEKVHFGSIRTAPPVHGFLRTDQEVIPIYLEESISGKDALIKGLNGQDLGTFFQTGEYVLTSGKTGQVFIDPHFCIGTAQILILPPKLQQNFKDHCLKISQASSLSSWIRKETGLQGDGVYLVLLDKDPQHASLCAEVISGFHYGVAAGTKFLAEKIIKGPTNIEEFSISGLEKLIVEGFNSTLDATSKTLQASIPVIENIPSVIRPKALILAYGVSRTELYDSFIKIVMPYLVSSKDQYSDSQLLQFVEKYQHLSSPERYQFIIEFVDHVLDQDQSKNASLKRYNQLVKRLKEAGTLTVVSVGNDYEKLPIGIKLKPDAMLASAAMSPDVISVAGVSLGTDPKLIQENLKQGKMPSFKPIPCSSEGTGNWKPTLAAPGAFLPIKGGFLYGTSCATYWVGGIIGLIGKANPKLKPDEIKALLIKACENPDNLPSEAVGAGLLNPVQAVKLARAWK